MNQDRKPKFYRLLILLALILSIITFTPLVMPYGRSEPTLFHLPFTLWTGLLVALLFVFLTWLSIRIHPGKEEDES
ncbi:MAG: hypothetical protein KAT15_21295 [Bacteroidales bacterium]|nr:hypothetical protein [Bacteroidales bacterium]